MIRLTNTMIDVDEVIRSVHSASAGGINVFIGTTRDHSSGKQVLSLRYEGYPPMALKEMGRIEEEARRGWKIDQISIVHRLGEVEIGEASVVIAVSAPHRSEAFECCRYAIDTLKKTVPIWKKEVFVDGEVWVGTQER